MVVEVVVQIRGPVAIGQLVLIDGGTYLGGAGRWWALVRQVGPVVKAAGGTTWPRQWVQQCLVAVEAVAEVSSPFGVG